MRSISKKVFFILLIMFNFTNANFDQEDESITKDEFLTKSNMEKDATSVDKKTIDIIPNIKVIGLEKIKHIGDKPIIIGIGGVGTKKAPWWVLFSGGPEGVARMERSKYDLLSLKWHQGKLTRGTRNKHIISGARELAKLILNIHAKIKLREISEDIEIKPEIIIVAHSMGGIVAKVALNLLNTLDQKLDELKGYTPPKLSNKLTKKYYITANKKIKKQIEKLKKHKLFPNDYLLKAVYTLGTPSRRNFPFIENMHVTEDFYCLFSYGDKIQKGFGLTRIPKGKNKFNIRVKIIKNDKEADPNHIELITYPTIMTKLLNINKESIENEIFKYIEKFKKENEKRIRNEILKEETESDLDIAIEKINEKLKEKTSNLDKEAENLKNSIQTITVTFPDNPFVPLIFNFETEKPPKERGFLFSKKPFEFKF